jgi:hypothetical protein
METSYVNRAWLAFACALSLGLAAACSPEVNENPSSMAAPAAAATTGKPGLHPKHDPSPSILAKGRAPKPPADAQTASTIGEGKLAVMTDNVGTDSDPFWIEPLDVDDDAQLEETDLLFDDEDGVLYLFTEKTFSCADGWGEGTGGLLVAVYGDGNAGGKPAGSGWYLAELGAGECNVKAMALWGCKFDANGRRTACGVASINEAEDDIAIPAPDPTATE